MPIELPLPLSGVYDWRIPYTLDGVRGALRMRYSQSTDRWSLTLFSSIGERVVGPVACATDEDLFAQWRAYDVPPGRLTVEYDPGGNPGRTDWGTAARLVYQSVNEL